MTPPQTVLAALLLLAPTTAPARPDVVIATFDGDDYAGWTTTGTAFGTGPAHGSLPHQQAVDGYLGRGFANSYHGGDAATGTLTSSPFTVDRDYLNFLVGSGRHPDETHVDLIVDGNPVRSTTGNDDEHLDPASWDVRPFRGRSAVIRVVDTATGGWGHLNVDHFVQSDTPAPTVAAEAYRPLYHFTPPKGWMNDPNGLVYADGEWHLFYQHNPDSLVQTPVMSWGHAVSPDLMHWTNLPVALTPDERGWIWSGSAVVDRDNTSGFGAREKPPLVAMYTAAKAPFSQHVAYSLDRGRTWTKYAGNPVIPHLAGDNRDPHVFWHEPTKRWVVVLFRDVNHEFALFDSPDLIHWSHLQDFRVPGCDECPDLFPLDLDGDRSKHKWAFTAANGRYVVGSFDGKTFAAEQAVRRVDYGRNYYAVQTYSDVPKSDGRRIQIAWMRGGHYPHQPFNQQMSCPAELTLRSTPDGPRLFRNPVREIDSLHGSEHDWSDLSVAGVTPLTGVSTEAADLRIDFVPGSARTVGLDVNGARLTYSLADGKLSALGSAAVPLVDGHLRLRVLVDRTSIETFADGGRVTFTSCYLPNALATGLSLFADGGTATAAVRAYDLRFAAK